MKSVTIVKSVGIETWEESEYYCPKCGNKGLYFIERNAPNFEEGGTIKHIHYLCVNCKTVYHHNFNPQEAVTVDYSFVIEKIREAT